MLAMGKHVKVSLYEYIMIKHLLYYIWITNGTKGIILGIWKLCMINGKGNDNILWDEVLRFGLHYMIGGITTY